MASLSVGGAIALGLSLTYIAASICAFAFPSLLHKRRRPPPCPVKFGSHRGTITHHPPESVNATPSQLYLFCFSHSFMPQ